MAWTVESAHDDRCRLRATLGPGWPWAGWCSHEVSLSPGHLRLSVEVHARDAPFPAVVGWHPWFAKPSAVELAAEALLERGPDHLPTGRRVPAPAPGDRPLDDCFAGVRWPVVLRGVAGHDLAIEAEGCDFAVVYDEQAGTTCVEAQTGPPDALRAGGAALVEPDRPLPATMRLRWS